MRKTTKESILKRLDAERKKLAKVRDVMRDLKDEVEEEFERVDDAWQSLDYAIDRISESV